MRRLKLGRIAASVICIFNASNLYAQGLDHDRGGNICFHTSCTRSANDWGICSQVLEDVSPIDTSIFYGKFSLNGQHSNSVSTWFVLRPDDVAYDPLYYPTLWDQIWEEENHNVYDVKFCLDEDEFNFTHNTIAFPDVHKTKSFNSRPDTAATDSTASNRREVYAVTFNHDRETLYSVEVWGSEPYQQPNPFCDTQECRDREMPVYLRDYTSIVGRRHSDFVTGSRRWEFNLQDYLPSLANWYDNASAEFEALVESLRDAGDTFPPIISEIREILDSISDLSFDELSNDYFGSVSSAKQLYESFKQEIANLEAQTETIKNNLSDELDAPTEVDTDEHLQSSSMSEADFEIELSTTFPDITLPAAVSDLNYSETNNIYTRYADTILADLQRFASEGNYAEFVSRSDDWREATANFRDVLLAQPFQSPRQWNDFYSNFQRVDDYISPIMGEDGWFRDSILSENDKRVIEELEDYYPAEAELISDEARSWRQSAMNAADIQLHREMMMALNALLAGVKEERNATGENSSETDSLVRNAVDVILENGKCLTVSVVAGDFGDWYEVVVGKSLCDGTQLSTGERVVSALGIAVGSGYMWRGAAKAIGILPSGKLVAKITADTLAKAERLGLSKDELDEIVAKLENSLPCSI